MRQAMKLRNFTQAAQKSTKSIDEASGLVNVELDGETGSLKRLLLKEVLWSVKDTSKRGDESNDPGTEAEEDIAKCKRIESEGKRGGCLKSASSIRRVTQEYLHSIEILTICLPV